VGLLREEDPKLKMRLMHRAVARLATIVGSAPVRTQWRLTEAVLEGLLSGDLALNYTRKRVLSLVERELGKFEEDCSNPAITASRALLNELVYLVNLCTKRHRACSEVFKRLGLKRLSVTDRVFQQEKTVLLGPDTETILTMAKALREEVSTSQDIVDLASRGLAGASDIAPLILMFQHTADILFVVGLRTPGEILLKIKNKIEAWVQHAEYSRDNLLEIADGLLYVETVLDNLSRGDLDFHRTQSEQTRLAVIAKSHRDEAGLAVVREAQVSLTAIEKDINAFVESGYKISHMRRVGATLGSVRGAVRILELDRAAVVLFDFQKLVLSVTRKKVGKKNIQSVLEVLADGLMAVEYYLSELELHGVAQSRILDIAEQSLATANFKAPASRPRSHSK